MRTVKDYLLIAGGLFFLFTVQCDKAPTKKVAVAQAELDSATSAEADIYASKDYEYVKRLLLEANNEIDILKEKRYFFFIRKYADVNKKLDTVILRAREAAEIAKALKEDMRVKKEMQ